MTLLQENDNAINLLSLDLHQLLFSKDLNNLETFPREGFSTHFGSLLIQPAPAPLYSASSLGQTL